MVFHTFRRGYKAMAKMVAEINYKNEQGHECSAVIHDCGAIHHTWYSSKRNSLGKFDRHDVTIFGAFMSKLKGCSNIRVNIKNESN